MVIYSSIIVFAAVICWRVFGKPLSHQQSLALAIITIGLAITAFDGAETQAPAPARCVPWPTLFLFRQLPPRLVLLASEQCQGAFTPRALD